MQRTSYLAREQFDLKKADSQRQEVGHQRPLAIACFGIESSQCGGDDLGDDPDERARSQRQRKADRSQNLGKLLGLPWVGNGQDEEATTPSFLKSSTCTMASCQ